MTTEERVLRLENAFATLAQLAASVTSRTDRLVELSVNFDERMGMLMETQRQTEANLQALTTIVSDLGHAQERTEGSLDALTKRVDSLAEIVERHISEGQG